MEKTIPKMLGNLNKIKPKTRDIIDYESLMSNKN